jgi:hypothetical protein
MEAAAGAYLGGKFYVMGGDDFNNALNTNYIFDTATNTWSTGAPLPAARTNVYATAYNGLIYLFGGVDASFAAVDTLYSYNPATNSWATLAPANTGGLGNYAGISPYGVGKLFVTDGGTTAFVGSNTTHIYDIASNSWSAGPPLAQARMAHAQGTLADGRVIVYSGLIPGTPQQVTSTSELLAPAQPCGTITPTPIVTSTNTPTRTATTAITPATFTRTSTATGTSTNTPTGTFVPPSNTPTGTETPGTPGTATVTATPCTINFIDVQESDWFYEFVRCVFCLGAVSGYDDGTFRPYNNTTRGQMVKIVILAFGYEIYIPPTAPTFTDTPPDHPFYQYVETAAYNNIVAGYDDGTFRPYNNVTRGQLSKIVVIAAGWALLNPPTPTFTDVDTDNPFYSEIETAYCHQIISGYDDGTFRPFNDATRAQIAKIVCLATQNLVCEEPPVPTPSPESSVTPTGRRP